MKLIAIFLLISSFTTIDGTCQKKQLPKKTKISKITPKTSNNEPSLEDTKQWIAEKMNKYCRVRNSYTVFKEKDHEGKDESTVREGDFHFEGNDLVFNYSEESSTTFYNTKCSTKLYAEGKVSIKVNYFKALRTRDPGFFSEHGNDNTWNKFPAISISTDGQNIMTDLKKEMQNNRCEKSTEHKSNYTSEFIIYLDVTSESNLEDRLIKAFTNMKNLVKAKEAY